nr:MAG TPA: hypothetical protein [Caudoviricetes sp.]
MTALQASPENTKTPLPQPQPGEGQGVTIDCKNCRTSRKTSFLRTNRKKGSLIFRLEVEFWIRG